ncbi:MAG: hypothetical protein AAGK09_00325 [Planctomycetota bacterium]
MAELTRRVMACAFVAMTLIAMPILDADAQVEPKTPRGDYEVRCGFKQVGGRTFAFLGQRLALRAKRVTPPDSMKTPLRPRFKNEENLPKTLDGKFKTQVTGKIKVKNQNRQYYIEEAKLKVRKNRFGQYVVRIKGEGEERNTNNRKTFDVEMSVRGTQSL